MDKDGLAEARLMEIYRLMANASPKLALVQARQLVTDYPQFQLAQLVYADLMMGRTRPLKTLGDAPPDVAQAGKLSVRSPVSPVVSTSRYASVGVVLLAID